MHVFVSRTAADIDFAFERLSSAAVLGCDTETSGLNSKFGKILSMQFSDGDFNVLVPLSEGVELGALHGLLSNAAIVKIFHNARFDLEFLRANKIAVENVFDTMIAEKGPDPASNQSASLAELFIDISPSTSINRSAQNSRENGTASGPKPLSPTPSPTSVHLPRLMHEQTAGSPASASPPKFQTQMQKLAL
jgi:DNA polymerase I-like protein with 3'-5' exonuclease and polymerase domains